MTAELSFALDDITIIGASVDRFTTELRPESHLRINYSVERAEYKDGGADVLIETAFRIMLIREEEADEENAEPLVELRSKVAVSLAASRPLQSDDASSGRLNAAQDVAHEQGFPYHRQVLAQLSSTVGYPAVSLPITWDAMNRAAVEAGLTS
jgi:hypothetical protein